MSDIEKAKKDKKDLELKGYVYLIVKTRLHLILRFNLYIQIQINIEICKEMELNCLI